MQAWTHLIMDCHTFAKVWGRLRWFGRHKSALVKCLFLFQLEMNAPGVLNVPTDKNLKDWGRAIVGVVPRNLSVWGHTVMYLWTFFPCLGVGPYSWRLLQHFRCAFCKLYFKQTFGQLWKRTVHLKMKRCKQQTLHLRWMTLKTLIPRETNVYLWLVFSRKCV
jgi:hypothetical protein